ncbi:MAG: GTPase Era, partial [Rickettsiales bacterium]|nr:GTPase Era [Rickettsiales bacterium]
MTDKEKVSKSGFVAIIGPTNAGKSTLLNAVMGRKASIVSHKVQTTRTRIRAVKMAGDSQLIFVDTPGIFKPARRLDRAMAEASRQAMEEADAILVLVDATHGMTDTVRGIVEILPRKKRIFAAINKTDAVPKDTLLPIAGQLAETGLFEEIFMISALRNEALAPMIKSIANAMPVAPYLFDQFDALDVPDSLWLAEITRGQIYRFVHQELPYHIHVSTDSMETAPDGVIEIAQTVYVKTPGHKKI